MEELIEELIKEMVEELIEELDEASLVPRRVSNAQTSWGSCTSRRLVDRYDGRLRVCTTWKGNRGFCRFKEAITKSDGSAHGRSTSYSTSYQDLFEFSRHCLSLQ
jgi:hypothetical protein